LKLPDFKNKIYVNSATSGIVTILEYLKYIGKENLAIPAYCHVSALTKSIEDFNIFIIDTEFGKPTISLDSLKKINKEKNIEVLLYSEINGYMGDIEKISKYCEENKIILIEDSAPSIIQNKAGTYGDFSVFSFSDSKYINCDGGGLLISKSPEAIEAMEFFQDYIRLSDKKVPYFFTTNMYLSKYLQEIIENQIHNFDPKSIYYKNSEIMKFSNKVSNDLPGTCGIFVKNEKLLETKLKAYNIKYKKFPHVLIDGTQEFPNSKNFYKNYILIDKDYNLENLKKVLK